MTATALAPPLALLRALELRLRAVLLGALGLRCRLTTACDGGVAWHVDTHVDRRGRRTIGTRRRARGRGGRRVGGRLVGVVDRSTGVGRIEPADRRVVEPRVRIGRGAGAGIRASRGARAWVRSGDTVGTRVVDVPAEADLVQAFGRWVVELRVPVGVHRGGRVVDSGVSDGAGGWGRGARAGGPA